MIVHIDCGILTAGSRRLARSWMPPLRRIAAIIPTKFHLAELPKLERLDELGLMTGIGRPWSFLASTSTVFLWVLVYILQFESVVAAWNAGDTSELQPPMANFISPLSVVIQLCKADATKREQELLGRSSGTHSRGMETFHDAKERAKDET